jgi:hypothetical protein
VRAGPDRAARTGPPGRVIQVRTPDPTAAAGAVTAPSDVELVERALRRVELGAQPLDNFRRISRQDADSGPTASSWAAPDSPREAPVCVLAVRRGGAGSARCLVPGPSPVRPRPSDELDLLERAHPGHKRSLHRASCSNPCRPVWRPYASVYAYRA